MIGYTEVTVIVDGALDATTILHTNAALGAFINSVETDAIKHGLETEVYILHHDHKRFDDGECACVQYLTDHHPDYTFNARKDVCEVCGAEITLRSGRCTYGCP